MSVVWFEVEGWPVAVIWGVRVCPRCHVKVKWKWRAWYSIPAKLIFMVFSAPFVLTGSFLVVELVP